MTPVILTSEITVELVRAMAKDQYVADAARVSTAGANAEQGKPLAGLIRALMREKHGSPFEHNLFTFRVHAPLFVWTEHLRHRIGWNYSGESGRYKVMEPVFYMPPPERPLVQTGKPMDYELSPGNPSQRNPLGSTMRSVTQEAYAEYEYLLNLGIAREVARQVLPTNLMATYYTSCNARSLMAFLSLRTEDEDATFPSKPLWEIQQVAAGYEEALAVAMPITHSAFSEFGRVAP